LVLLLRELFFARLKIVYAFLILKNGGE